MTVFIYLDDEKPEIEFSFEETRLDIAERLTTAHDFLNKNGFRVR